MIDTLTTIGATIVCTTLFCLMTVKTVGAMQQSGYKNKTFLRWLRRDDNLFFNRLCVLALCLALTTAITSLCFSFLGKTWALAISAIPFLGFLTAFLIVDCKYALKVPYTPTGRACRLFAVYYLFTAGVCYGLITLLSFLSAQNGSSLYALIAYVPFAVMPLLLPFLLCAANAIASVFENIRNRRFVKRAGQVLNERKIIRIAVVGSYGKTSVKNILKTLLEEKYSVVETPESYNTPIGVAKTFTSSRFVGKDVLIAEMGARKAGDISELCRLVQPDYAIFTGVCEQHISTFGSLQAVFEEKSSILKCGVKKAVCGESLKELLSEKDGLLFAGLNQVKDLRLEGETTRFTFTLGGKEIVAKTALLGNAAAENILLAATLAFEMGVTPEEIERGISKLQPIPHRLQLLKSNGVYILDDGYNCNPKGAKEAISALTRFSGRKCIVTPGIVECGVLEEKINGELGEEIAKADLDKVILVGDTLIGAVKSGFEQAGGNMKKLTSVQTLIAAQVVLADWLIEGDAVLFLNDLPDVY
jgi:UDP-N-acetylmuramoyl-tripeptide--D-alanyl-D-alanine ligase